MPSWRAASSTVHVFLASVSSMPLEGTPATPTGTPRTRKRNAKSRGPDADLESLTYVIRKPENPS